MNSSRNRGNDQSGTGAKPAKATLTPKVQFGCVRADLKDLSEVSPSTNTVAYGYVRTAAAGGRANGLVSLAAQCAQLASFFRQKNQQGSTLRRTIRDQASGSDTLDRPGLRRLLKAAGNGEFDILVVTSQDRLARTWGNLCSLVEKLEAHGIRIFDVTGRRTSLNDTTSRMFTTMASSWTEQERNAIRARRIDRARSLHQAQA